MCTKIQWEKNYSCAGLKTVNEAIRAEVQNVRHMCVHIRATVGDTLDTPSVLMANGAPVEVSPIYVYYSVEFVSVVTDYSTMKGMKKWQMRRNASCQKKVLKPRSM